MIFLDVDGVLADLDKAVVSLLGTQEKTIKELIDNNIIKDYPKLWHRIKEKTDPIKFFAELPTYPWFDLLVRTCLKHDEVFIATSMSPHFPEMATGKAMWLESNLGLNFGRRINIALIREKHRLARSKKDILIDDFKWQTNRFTEAGGSALLFPSKGNIPTYMRTTFESDIKDLVNGTHSYLYRETVDG